MFKALRMILIALFFAAAMIGASWGTKGLWYENYLDMGIYMAFAIYMSCEAACGGACGFGRHKLVSKCE